MGSFSMKIYRDMKRILWRYMLYIFCSSILFIVMLELVELLMIDKSGGGLGFILVLLLIGVGIIVLYSVYCVILHLFCIYQPTIEITEAGIRYPYLLRDNPEISWENIKKFEYIEDSDGDSTSYYIVVELENSIDVGAFKKVPGLSLLKAVQKKYDHPILIFFEDIIKDYSLPDLADRLNAERKRMTAPHAFIHKDEPVFYSKSDMPLTKQLTPIGLTSVGFLAPPYFLIRDNSELKIFMMIFGAVMILIILKLLYDRIREFFSPDIAISFDEEGIEILDDQKFSPPIAWQDVLSIEIETQQKGKKIAQPVLVIELKSSVNADKKYYEIFNTLKDTSVYEVKNSLDHYY